MYISKVPTETLQGIFQFSFVAKGSPFNRMFHQVLSTSRSSLVCYLQIQQFCKIVVERDSKTETHVQ